MFEGSKHPGSVKHWNPGEFAPENLIGFEKVLDLLKLYILGKIIRPDWEDKEFDDSGRPTDRARKYLHEK